MKSRPMLFSAPMVRALLDGRKNQTRRVSGFEVINADPERFDYLGVVSGPGEQHHVFHDKQSGAQTLVRCRSGQRGDQLWVRENFKAIYPQDPTYNGGDPIEYDYAATYKHGDRLGDLLGIKPKWKPSIHMPRLASRITLQIVSIRVERLQDISEADAIAEGITCENVIVGCNGNGGVHHEETAHRYFFHGCQDEGYETGIDAFAALWESINGPGSWEANPFVWVVEFRKVTP